MAGRMRTGLKLSSKNLRAWSRSHTGLRLRRWSGRCVLLCVNLRTGQQHRHADRRAQRQAERREERVALPHAFDDALEAVALLAVGAAMAGKRVAAPGEQHDRRCVLVAVDLHKVVERIGLRGDRFRARSGAGFGAVEEQIETHAL